MNSVATGLVVFASLYASVMLAMRLRMGLPAHHLNADSNETMKLSMGLVATMTALVLGLLVSTTKGTYDTEKIEITQVAAKIIYLDRVLASYGPESSEARAALRQGCENAIKRLWPEGRSQQAAPATSSSEVLRDSIQNLSPQNDGQQAAKGEAVRVAAEIGQMSWLLFEQLESSISMTMLVIVVCWLAVLFFSFGLFAPSNGTARGSLLVAALSVSAAIFLIMELDQPFHGFIQISSQPMQSALAHLGK
jgi:hypothetical protein